MSFYGVGLNAAVDRLQLQIKLTLASKHGGTALRKMAKLFAEFDKDSSGSLDFYEFEAALRQLGIFYKKIDSQALFNFYDKNGDGSISYQEFVDSLRTTLSPYRANMVREVFMRLDINKNGEIDPKEMGYLYQAHNKYEVVMGHMTPGQAVQAFFALFDMNSNGKISWHEFARYYADVGAIIQGDESFGDLLNKTWGVNLQNKQIDKNFVQKFVKLIREKLIVYTSGVRDEFKLREIYLSFDKTNSNLLSLEDFDAMMLCLGIEVPEKCLPALFEALDVNNSGYIEFEEFQNFILYDPYK